MSLPGATQSLVKNKDSQVKQNSDKSNPNQITDPALLEITGAPNDAQFNAQSTSENRAWTGDYMIQLKGGNTKLLFKIPMAKNKFKFATRKFYKNPLGPPAPKVSTGPFYSESSVNTHIKTCTKNPTYAWRSRKY